MKKALLVLPRAAMTPRDISRCINSIGINFPGIEIALGAFPQVLDSQSRQYGVPLTLYTGASSVAGYAVVAFAESAQDQEAAALQRATGRKVHRFDLANNYFRARLAVVGGVIGEEEYPKFNSHAFNRLSPSTTDMFYYFPYGYLFRCTGLGPLNEFGHRIARPIKDLEKRDPNHKVIVVFGGSAAWSLDCLHDEMFASRLEVKLNEASASTGNDLRFTVLNMGQHGNVVLNEMMSYLLFCDRLRPELVIAHDGFNDFCYGMIQDSALLGQNEICYQDNLEGWSQLLHGTKDRPVTTHGENPYRVRNAPLSVVRAYVSRKDQFRRVVEANGGQFIWGLQPYVFSKRGLSPEEEQDTRQRRIFESQHGEAYKLIGQLYQMMDQVPLLSKMNTVNVHKEFGKYDGTRMLFADTVHPSPEGDELIGQLYAERVSQMVASGQFDSAKGAAA